MSAEIPGSGCAWPRNSLAPNKTSSCCFFCMCYYVHVPPTSASNLTMNKLIWRKWTHTRNIKHVVPSCNNLIQYSLSVSMCLPTFPSVLIPPMQAVWFSMLISLHATYSASCLHPTAQTGGRRTTRGRGNMTQTRIKEMTQRKRQHALAWHFTTSGGKNKNKKSTFFSTHTEKYKLTFGCFKFGTLVLSVEISQPKNSKGKLKAKLWTCGINLLLYFPITFPDICNHKTSNSLQVHWNNGYNWWANLRTHKTETCLLPFDRCSLSSLRGGCSANAFLMSTTSTSPLLWSLQHTHICLPVLNQRNKSYYIFSDAFIEDSKLLLWIKPYHMKRESFTRVKKRAFINLLFYFHRWRCDFFYLLSILFR